MQRFCGYTSFTELEIVKDTHLCYIDFMMKEMRDKMALINNLKRIRHLPNNVLASFRMIGDSRISTLQKAAFIGLAGGYLLWPNDLIIDIPLIGQLDDMAVFLILYGWFMSKVPEDIRQEHGWKDIKY